MTGTVIRLLSQDSALVSLGPREGCSGSCAACGSACEEAGKLVTAQGLCGARPGDRVQLQRQRRPGEFLAWLIAPAAFLCGYWASSLVNANTGVTAVVSIVCLLSGCSSVSRLQKQLKKRSVYRILSIED